VKTKDEFKYVYAPQKEWEIRVAAIVLKVVAVLTLTTVWFLILAITWGVL